MTDGVLLAELSRDRDLRAYDTIVIDEAHERSLTIDFLLGYLKQLLPRRPDLKLVITSATIDPERFSRHFDDAPVLTVSGRTYPVEVRYRPMLEDEDQTAAIVRAVAELPSYGDVLVFLSGEREIRDTADALAGGPDEVVPLYGRLSSAEQHRVFADHTGRRIVLATNVAETSLTVPGIRYVVDPGRRGSRGSTAGPRCSGCRSRRSARPRRCSAPVGAAGSRTASASGCTPRRTSSRGRSSPSRRSCGPTSRRCCCRWRRRSSATSRTSRSSSRRTRGRSATASRCSRSSAHWTATG